MADHRCDVAVIGAGIIGLSIAFHLARMGGGDVTVLDREPTPGAGSTAKAAGGLRAQFSSAINIELSRRSIERFERFPEEMGVEAPFRQAGYLWIASDGGQMERLERAAETQRRHGLAVELLDARGVAARAPYVRTDDVIGGAFHAKDGYASPADFVRGYHKRAVELGVRFLFGEEVVGREGTTLRMRGGASVKAGRAVLATGAWSGELGRMLGFDIPVQPIRRQCFVTNPLPELPHPVPMTIDCATGVYLHSESKGLLVGMADPEERPGFDESVRYAFIERIAERAMRRVPALERAAIKTAWGGLYEVTPDSHPLLGELGGGFYAATGFSGHGVMHAPAAGELLAELLVRGRTSLDLSCLGPGRFREGKLNVETHVI